MTHVKDTSLTDVKDTSVGAQDDSVQTMTPISAGPISAGSQEPTPPPTPWEDVRLELSENPTEGECRELIARAGRSFDSALEAAEALLLRQTASEDLKGLINNCPCCLEDKNCVKLQCGHPYCLTCLIKQLGVNVELNVRNRCPLCRRLISADWFAQAQAEARHAPITIGSTKSSPSAASSAAAASAPSSAHSKPASASAEAEAEANAASAMSFSAP